MDHDTYMNYMDDDTIEVGCHYCRWWEPGFEDDDSAELAIQAHEEEDDGDGWHG